ncbi:MAG: hypothetical protein R2706_10200 [Acidimicrobiales bacterium]
MVQPSAYDVVRCALAKARLAVRHGKAKRGAVADLAQEGALSNDGIVDLGDAFGASTTTSTRRSRCRSGTMCCQSQPPHCSLTWAQGGRRRSGEGDSTATT